VMVIDHGMLAFDGDLDTLRGRAAAERTLVVDLAEPAPPLEIRACGCRGWTVRGSGWRSRRRTARPGWWPP
jgi:ABC-2 type transport system ATP-binding protein